MAETLAILGGDKVRTQPYPQWPVHDDRDIEAVTRVVKSDQWGGFPYPGSETQKFIDSFVELHDGQYGVAMINGTITMIVALRAAGIGMGDEVIVPAYTFQATAAAPLEAGAIPVIVDIDPDTYCISPQAIEAAITDKTRAIIPVHIGAQMADMDAIMDIANRYDLIVIEDAAHAHGARWNGKGAGTIGHFGSFSMQSSKTLTGGEGGMLLCQSQEMAYRAASIIDCGRPHDPNETLYTMGLNYRMSELHAALLNVGIERFPAQFKEREAMGAYFEEALSEVEGVRILPRDTRHTSRSLFCYVFALEPDAFGATNKIVNKALNTEGIPSFTGYPPMTKYDLFQPQLSRLPAAHTFLEQTNMDAVQLPVTERASGLEAIWLPENVFRAGHQGIDDVVNALKKIQNNLASDDTIANRIEKQ